jgi:AraC-like DNA-binding protein
MLTPEQINRIHRLHFAEQWSIRRIARHLHVGRRTIAHYLATPAPTAARDNAPANWIRLKATVAELREDGPKS